MQLSTRAVHPFIVRERRNLIPSGAFGPSDFSANDAPNPNLWATPQDNVAKIP